MKTALTGLLCAASMSCTVTTTTNTLPDGTKVVVVAKSTDPAAIASAINAAQALAPIIKDLTAKQTPPTPVALPVK